MQAVLCDANTIVNNAVSWFKDTSIPYQEQLARKISAVVLAIFLSLTIVGIYFVIKEIQAWIHEPGLDKNVAQAALSAIHSPQHRHEGSFPEPYAKLRQMGLDNPQQLEPIRRRLKNALTHGNTTFYPHCYIELQTAIGSEDKCRKLFDEGLILIHYLCLREYGGVRINLIDYQKFVRPYMDMLFSYLLEHRKFPDNIYQDWVLD